MPGKIDFRYDKESDVVIATPHWKLVTQDDVLEWYRRYDAYLKRFKRKMDFVAVLDDFEIGPAIGVFWGEYRAKLHQQYLRIAYVVNSNSRVRLYRNTSGVKYDVVMCDAASVEDAILGIKESRRLLEEQAT